MNLYYYTSTDTMRYILGSGDIYATNIRYMNDSEEYTNGLNEIKVLMENEELVQTWINKRGRSDVQISDMKNTFTDENLERNKANREFYSISFCEKNDLLSQWAIYAKEAGVSIQMEFKEGKKYNFSTQSCNGDTSPKARWSLKPEAVHYFTRNSMGTNKYNKKANAILDKLYEEENVDLAEDINERWQYVSVYVKRYDFYQEAERRIVFQPKKSVEAPKIMYRQDKNVLKPYLDIECENGWPIQKIMVGPGFNQNVVYDSVVHFLNNAKVQSGMKKTDDYIKKIQEYFAPCDSELQKIPRYKPFKDALSHGYAIKGMDMYGVQRILGNQVQSLCDEICNTAAITEETKDYVKNNYFSKSGIVVLKSSIPYIF
jgi:hypothetical protein